MSRGGGRVRYIWGRGGAWISVSSFYLRLGAGAFPEAGRVGMCLNASAR